MDDRNNNSVRVPVGVKWVERVSFRNIAFLLVTSFGMFGSGMAYEHYTNERANLMLLKCVPPRVRG